MANETGTLFIEALVEVGTQIPLAAQLKNSSHITWHTNENGLFLTPQEKPTHYVFTLELDTLSASSFTLEGVRLYRQSIEEPNTLDAKIFIPASSTNSVTSVEIQLIHDFENGDPVIYNMGIGLNNGSNTFWPDPTISFDPQG